MRLRPAVRIFGRYLRRPGPIAITAMLCVVASSVYVVSTTQHPTPDTTHHHVTEPDPTRAALAAPTVVPRIGWTVTADSQDTANHNVASNVLDGNTSTIWHTQWTPTFSPLPHHLTIDMHATRAIAGLTYLPRPASTGRN